MMCERKLGSVRKKSSAKPSNPVTKREKARNEYSFVRFVFSGTRVSRSCMTFSESANDSAWFCEVVVGAVEMWRLG